MRRSWLAGAMRAFRCCVPFAVLLGPSGCGKTMVLSIVGGFLTATEGSVSSGLGATGICWWTAA